MEPKLVTDARALSSGTLSYLVNDTRYSVIDQVQADFIEFCQECPHYETWVEAWHAFTEVYDLSSQSSNILPPP